METSSSIKLILGSIAIGIWVLVLQNFGLFSEDKTQSVRVVNSVGINGSVEVEGRVNIGNTVDVNLQEINGHNNVFFNNPRRGDHNKYYVIPVSTE